MYVQISLNVSMHDYSHVSTYFYIQLSVYTYIQVQAFMQMEVNQSLLLTQLIMQVCLYVSTKTLYGCL